MPGSLCRRLAPALLLVSASACLPAGLTAAASAEVPKPYIVVFEKSSAPAARAATSDIVADADIKTTQRYDDAVHGFAARLDSRDLRAIRDDPRVAAVVPDRPVKAAALVPLAAGDNIPAGVRRVGAAVNSTVHEASTANVAVVDTGIDLTHPDLNAVAGTNCNGTGAPNDDNGHGTHVAGTIAAKNDGSGAVGVAPGTKLYAVKVLNAGGSGYTSNVVCGIDWVTATRTDGDPSNDINVVNMSLGGGAPPDTNCGHTINDPEHMAICASVAAGVAYVVAAGNNGSDLQNHNPANYPEVLTVTSVSDSDGVPGGVGGNLSCIGNADDTPASYSNYATRAVDIAHTIAAPGSCIRSTYPGGMYATMSGTSMASPHVAGLVALCMGENGAHGPCWGQSPADVRSIMLGAAATEAALNPPSAFSGAPSKPIAGKYYGDMAGTQFPSAAGTTPVNTAYPAITGTPTTGATLTAGNGTWTGAATIAYAVQWLRCTTGAVASCSDIPGATGTTYTPVTADLTRFLRIRVTASNTDGAAVMRSTATAAITAGVSGPPANTAYPAISGSATTSATLTATSGTWTGSPTITYATQWLRCTTGAVTSCANIAGATASTYAPASGDVGRFLRVSVTATNSRGTATMRSYATAAVTGAGSGVVAPVNTAYPAITGTATVGRALSASAGTWTATSPSYAYQWLRCTSGAVASCTNISGATTSSYTLVAADRGKYVRISVTATNSAGTASMRSYSTALVS
jgi:subtilisin